MNTPYVDSTVATSLKPAQSKVQDAALGVQPALAPDQPDFAQMVVLISRTPTDPSAPKTVELESALMPVDEVEQQSNSQSGRSKPDDAANAAQVTIPIPDSHSPMLGHKEKADTSKDHNAGFAPIEPAAVDAPPKSRPMGDSLQAGTWPQETNRPFPIAAPTAPRKTPPEQLTTKLMPTAQQKPAEKLEASNHPATQATVSRSSPSLPSHEVIKQTLVSTALQTGPQSPQPDGKSHEQKQVARPVAQDNAERYAANQDAGYHAPAAALHVSNETGNKDFSPDQAQLIAQGKPGQTRLTTPAPTANAAASTAPDVSQPTTIPRANRPVNILVNPPAALPDNSTPTVRPADVTAQGAATAEKIPESARQSLATPQQAAAQSQQAGAPPPDFSSIATDRPSPLSGAISTMAATPIAEVRLSPQGPLAEPVRNSAILSPSTQLFTLIAEAGPASPRIQNDVQPLPAHEKASVPSTALNATEIAQTGTRAAPDAIIETPRHGLREPERVQHSIQIQVQTGPLLSARNTPKITPVTGSPPPVDHTIKTDPALTLLAATSEGGEVLHWDPLRASPTNLPNPMRSDLTAHIARQLVEVLPQAAHRPVEIALSPQELGRVRMSITTDDGAVTVNILAERADTLDLMRRNIEQLGQSFRNMGYDQITFSFGQGMNSDGQGEGTDQGDQQATDLNANDTEDTPALSDLKGPALRVQTTGIDIRL